MRLATRSHHRESFRGGGNSAVLGLNAVRPEALRRQLSLGLPSSLVRGPLAVRLQVSVDHLFWLNDQIQSKLCARIEKRFNNRGLAIFSYFRALASHSNCWHQQTPTESMISVIMPT